MKNYRLKKRVPLLYDGGLFDEEYFRNYYYDNKEVNGVITNEFDAQDEKDAWKNAMRGRLWKDVSGGASIGAGVGGVAGAATGSALGTLVAPLLGTAIGGVGGKYLGAAIGGIAGGIGGLTKGIFERGKYRRDFNEGLEEATSMFQKEELDKKKIEDNAIWANNNYGMGNTVMAKGGRIYSTGGNIGDFNIPQEHVQRLNKNAVMLTNQQGGVQGSHESGQNIPIEKGGQPAAYGEPGEVIVETPDGQSVAMSKRLGYAQKYTELDTLKKQLKSKIVDTTDKFKKNEILRQVDALDKQMLELVAEQAMVKQQMEQQQGGEPMMASGGDLDDLINTWKWSNSTDFKNRPKPRVFSSTSSIVPSDMNLAIQGVKDDIGSEAVQNQLYNKLQPQFIPYEQPTSIPRLDLSNGIEESGTPNVLPRRFSVNDAINIAIGNKKATPYIAEETDEESPMDNINDRLFTARALKNAIPTDTSNVKKSSRLLDKAGLYLSSDSGKNMMSDVAAGLNTLDNYITNANARKTLKNMPIPKGELYRFTPQNVTENVQPIINKTEQSVQATLDSVERNSSSAQRLGAISNSLTTAAQKSYADIYKYKSDTERARVAENQKVKDAVTNANKAMDLEYRQNIYNRDVTADVTMKSQLANQKADMVNRLLTNREQRQYQDKQLQLEGVKYANDKSHHMTMPTDIASFDATFKSVDGKMRETELRNAYLNNQGNSKRQEWIKEYARLRGITL